MTFKKLALASAIASLPMAAMAVDNLDDSMLGGVTGQDGIQISLDLNLTGLTTVIHDRGGIDGYAGSVTGTDTQSFPGEVDLVPNGVLSTGVVTGANGAYAGGKFYLRTAPLPAPLPGVLGTSGDADITTPLTLETFDFQNDGAIVIAGTSVVANDVIVQIDAGAAAATAANGVLNVNVDLSTGATVQTGAISVANSNRDDVASLWGVEAGTDSGTLIDSTTLTLGATQLNIQLGDEPQGNMIRVDTQITGGLRVTSFAMNDVGGAVSGGSIGAGEVAVVDAGSGNSGTGNLTNVIVGIDVDEVDGLVVNVLGLGNGGMDVFVENVYLGTTTLGMVGDIEMRGMNLAGTSIALTGK